MPKRGSAIIGKAITREIPLPAGEVSLVTIIPWTLVKRGMKKEIITPLGAPAQFQEEAEAERQDKKLAQVSALVKALGLAYHWQKLLDSGKAKSISEIAEWEELNKAHVSRLLKLALLAPELVQDILQGKVKVSVDVMKKTPLPTFWGDQVGLLERLNPTPPAW